MSCMKRDRRGSIFPRDSSIIFNSAAFISSCASASAAARFSLPTRTLREDAALPSGVLAPVDRVQGFHERISTACRAFCSSVQCRAMIHPFKIVRYAVRSVAFCSSCVHVAPLSLATSGFVRSPCGHHVWHFTVAFFNRYTGRQIQNQAALNLPALNLPAPYQAVPYLRSCHV